MATRWRCRSDEAANVRFRCLSGFASHRANLQAECLCGHKGVLDAVKLRRWFFCHRWNDALGGGRLPPLLLNLPWPVDPAAAYAGKPGPARVMALEHDWKELMRRLRD